MVGTSNQSGPEMAIDMMGTDSNCDWVSEGSGSQSQIWSKMQADRHTHMIQSLGVEPEDPSGAFRGRTRKDAGGITRSLGRVFPQHFAVVGLGRHGMLENIIEGWIVEPSTMTKHENKWGQAWEFDQTIEQHLVFSLPQLDKNGGLPEV